MVNPVALHPKPPRAVAERVARARERSVRSRVSPGPWGEHPAGSHRVEAKEEALAALALYEPLPGYDSLLRTRKPTVLPLDSRIAGESSILCLEWVERGSYRQLRVLRAPLPGGRAAYVARGTLSVRLLAATETRGERAHDLRFLQALFARNGGTLGFELLTSPPTDVRDSLGLDRIFLTDLFWAAFDEAPGAWDQLGETLWVAPSGDWRVEVPPIHDCLLSDGTPVTTATKLRILDEYLDGVIR